MKCEGCPFGGPLVGCGGDPEADVVFVGEGPGGLEIAEGRPFVGPTGQLLWDTLRKVGLPEDFPVMTDNAVRCRTPGNLAQHKDSDQALQACREHLLDDLRSSPRRLIVALGNMANWSIAGKSVGKITQIRGRVYYRDIGLEGPTPILPVVHPSAILRSTQDYGQFAADLRYAVDIILRRANIKDPGTTQFIVATEDNYRRILQGIATRGGLVSVDIENSGRSFSPRKERLLCIGMSWDKNRAAVFDGDLVLGHWDEFRSFFSTPGIDFDWHGGKYDSGFFIVGPNRDGEGGYQPPVSHDSMLAHYALNEIKGTHDLEQVASDVIGAPDYKDEVKQWIRKPKVEGFERLPKAILHKRSAQDVDYTRQITVDLLERLSRPENKGPQWAYKNVMLPAASFLARVESRGIWVDRGNLEQLRWALTEQLEEADRALRELVAASGQNASAFKPSSPAHVAFMMYRVFKIQVPKGFLPDTRKETVAAILERVQLEPAAREFLLRIQRFRKAAKALGTYVEGMEKMIDVDERIHTTFNIHGTVTGRLSSSRPNLQNIPRDGTVKRIFGAPQGRMLIDIDYNQAEPRVLTHLSGDRWLYEVYTIQKRSLHKEFSVARYGEDYNADQYIRAKATTLGIMYGRGGASIAQEYNFSVAEGEELVRFWYSQAKEAAEFIRRCRQAVYRGGVLQSPFGRRRRFTLVTDQNLHELQNEAANFPMSSTASDLTLIAAMAMEDTLSEDDARTLVLVHDSNLIELPLDGAVLCRVATNAVKIAEALPGKVLNAKIPFPVEIKAGTHWGELKELPHPIEHPDEFRDATYRLVEQIVSSSQSSGSGEDQGDPHGSSQPRMVDLDAIAEESSDEGSLTALGSRY